MIVQGDIEIILHQDCQQFEMPVYPAYNVPQGKVEEERIVIIPKTGSIDTYWEKCYVEVNFCVPDSNGEANLIRLHELERIAVAALKKKVGVYDGTRYRYTKESTDKYKDEELGCHFVNMRLLFEILNAE